MLVYERTETMKNTRLPDAKEGYILLRTSLK